MENWIANFIEFMPILLKGTIYTVEITLASIVLSTVLGFIWALVLLSRYGLLKKTMRVIINVVRGTPLLVQMFYVYFVLPDIGIRLTALQAGIIGLSICYSAYHAEIFRAGIISISSGQWEAARAIGFKNYQIMARIVLPQAARVILPPLGTSFIILLKDSSLASVITVRELTRSGQLLASTTFENMQVFTLVALIYISLTQVLAYLIQHLEKRYKIP